MARKTSTLKEHFLIVGPIDHDDLLTFWSNDLGWVDRDSATLFDARILATPLPIEARGVLDIDTMKQYDIHPLPGEGETLI